jgi:hypothetical protein
MTPKLPNLKCIKDEQVKFENVKVVVLFGEEKPAKIVQKETCEIPMFRKIFVGFFLLCYLKCRS